MVEIKNYCKSIKSRPILNNVSYNFEYGKIYGIYGHNGSGKTMLLRAIAGLLVPDSGSVVIDGKVLHKDMSFPPSIGIVIEPRKYRSRRDSQSRRTGTRRRPLRRVPTSSMQTVSYRHLSPACEKSKKS